MVWAEWTTKMYTSDDLKVCICGAIASVFMSSTGLYFCEKCGEERHYDEPVKVFNNNFFGGRIQTLVTSGTSLSTISTSTII